MLVTARERTLEHSVRLRVCACVCMYVCMCASTTLSWGKNTSREVTTLCSWHLAKSSGVALYCVFLFSQNSRLVCLMPMSPRPKQLTGGFGHELARVTSSLCKVLLRFLFLTTLIKRIVHHYTSLADTNHMPRQILRGSEVIHSINPLLHKVTVNPGSHKWVEG